ncbi:TRAFAC clade GTPase domain-containing protein [Sphingomonas sp.]|uniref:TRAFAC clade GTPase domain-containing protein n=1 Tax=Sphingomonas sp. TaxID=28214 RepID=UPI0028AC9459|nr:hypothetical protein [Sphingomonas sp.]
MANASPSCTSPDCNFNQDGSCAIDDDPETCRFRGGRPLIIDEGDEDDRGGGNDRGFQRPEPGSEAEPSDEQEPLASQVELSLGEKLSLAQCSTLLAQYPSQIVSFIAPKDAGKTSLIAGLYELFLEGRQESVLFRSSRTILGFERLCHFSRAASGRVKTDMERTRRSEGLGYFHLDLATPLGRLGLLLGDRPGEQFVSAAESIESAKALVEIPSASTLVYLIDGRVLGNPRTKGIPGSLANNILDAIVEAKLIFKMPTLAVVLTKADLLLGDTKEKHLARFAEIVSQLSQRYADSFSRVVGFVTAAYPDTTHSEYPRGSGLGALLDQLLVDTRTTYDVCRTPQPPSRYYERLGTQGFDEE